MIQAERLLQTFLDLVRIDSPSRNEKAVAQYLREILERRGYQVEMDAAATVVDGDCGNLIVRIAATGPGDCRGFSAHMDCVPPCTHVQPVVENGTVRSAGQTVLGGDDKAGIAAILEAVFHLEEEQIPHPELCLVFTVCEELGLLGAKALDIAALPQEMIVLDASGSVGTLIVRSPAKQDIRVVFQGRSAHAGMEPEQGISAIQMAAAAIGKMRLLRIDAQTVANLGRIEGGTKTNVVADSVVLTAEVRSEEPQKFEAQLKHMRECCEQAAQDFGGEIVFEHMDGYPALQVSEKNPLVERACKLCRELDLVPVVQGTGGGSDANIFAGHGIQCLNLGIGMTKVHTVDEYITTRSLLDTARLTAALMQS